MIFAHSMAPRGHGMRQGPGKNHGAVAEIPIILVEISTGNEPNYFEKKTDFESLRKPMVRPVKF